MKKLDISAITNSAQFFPKRGTLQFLQLAFQEGFAEMIKSLIGASYSTSNVYVLRGVVDSGVHPTYTTTAGFVFYNEEFFLIDAANFTATGSNVAVFQIVQTQYTTDADPCVFSDATSHNIHNIRKMQLIAAASGSNAGNLSAAVYMSFTIPKQLNLSASGQASISGVYPNLSVDVPLTGSLNPALTSDVFHVGDLQDPGIDYSVVFPAAIGTAVYYVMGSMFSSGSSANNDCTAVWTVRNFTTAGFTLHVNEYAHGITQDLYFHYIVFAR